MRLPPKFLGGLAYYLLRVLGKTLSVRYEFHPGYDKQVPGVYGFWHDKQLAPILLLADVSTLERKALVSASYDGDIVATCLSKLGYGVVRGSSSRQAVRSLLELVAVAKEGVNVGIAADGPRGPRFQAKSGMAYIAQKANMPIVPVGVAFSRKKIFKKAWDHFQLPYPFSRVVLYLGEPFVLPPEQKIAEANAQISAAISQADQLAADKLVKVY